MRPLELSLWLVGVVFDEVTVASRNVAGRARESRASVAGNSDQP